MTIFFFWSLYYPCTQQMKVFCKILNNVCKTKKLKKKFIFLVLVLLILCNKALFQSRELIDRQQLGTNDCLKKTSPMEKQHCRAI
ncbi:hypothetical protein T4B_9747 [Trichinella pseudospiralis]|uniref:Uncharacterized protein n=1 Tax=Trichinella pseudospiralis TaxID=6337 RepID=A0A0V1EC23_TRIPS|nr:hypothetical protein T4A_7304 [Trichinella pseudospiralis]KRZ22929.1 hypothetical protein T4B_9747 [Trichinella pseudospiralis]KRZ39652.1 hypothetical protein T4C_933 [Trichinella pseudospiralis]